MKNNPSPRISVIIATYNSSHTLVYTLKSLLNQTFQDFEAWIIGDACTDDSEQVVLEFHDDRLHWYNRTENSGSQPAPNNEGMKRAQGEYIAFLGHDDLWLPQHLEELLTHAETNRLIFTHSITILLSPDGIEQVRGKCHQGTSLENFVAPPSSWFMKREIMDQVGLWEENYHLLDTTPDQDYFGRIARKLGTISPLEKLTVVKFQSTVWNSYKNQVNLASALKKYWTEIENNPDQLLLDLLNSIAYEFSQFTLRTNILSPRSSLGMIKRHYLKIIHSIGDRIPGIRKYRKKRSIKKFQLTRQKVLIMRGLK